jgi:hypothetical protein
MPNFLSIQNQNEPAIKFVISSALTNAQRRKVMKAKTSYFLKLTSMILGLALMFWGIYSKLWWGALGVPLFIYGISPRRSDEEFTVNLEERSEEEKPPKKVA